MGESPLEISRVELSIGDSVRWNDQILTVLDICDDEVTFRIDTVEATDLDNADAKYLESGSALCYGNEENRFPPR